MAYFEVNIAGLRQMPSVLEEIGTNLQDLDRRLISCMENLSEHFSETVQVRTRLEENVGYLHKTVTRVNGFAESLGLICGRYEYYEGQAANSMQESAEGGEYEEHSGVIPELASEIIKEAGLFGMGYKIGGDISSGVQNLKQENYTDAMKDFVGAKDKIENVSSSVVKKYNNLSKAEKIMSKDAVVKNGLKSAFGLDSYYNAKDTLGAASKAKDMSTRWYNNYKKAEYKEMGGITKAGVISQGISSAISNYAEYKSGEISAGRAVLETVGETAVGTVKKVAVSTVAAAAVATVFGGAPLFAVAGASIAINWGLDKLAGKITGGKKDFTELLSDTCLDVGSYIGNVVTGKSNIVQDAKAKFSSFFAKNNKESKGAITPSGNFKFAY